MNLMIDPGNLLLQSPVLLLLLGASIITAAIALERWYWYRKTQAPVEEFASILLKLVRSQNMIAAVDLCRQSPSQLARIARAALPLIGRPREEQRELLRVQAERCEIEMEENLGILATIGHGAPLLGLLGTVVGIIRAFRGLGGTGMSAELATGVAEALITTAGGIVVALLATVVFNHLIRRARLRRAELDELSTQLIELGMVHTRSEELSAREMIG